MLSPTSQQLCHLLVLSNGIFQNDITESDEIILKVIHTYTDLMLKRTCSLSKKSWNTLRNSFTPHVIKIINLSDLECDYINATTCCRRLNVVSSHVSEVFNVVIIDCNWNLKSFQYPVLINHTPKEFLKLLRRTQSGEIYLSEYFKAAGIFCWSHSTGHNYRSLNICPKTA